jgi:hypothetical protein|mmetsp:Transcript_26617/g.45181  ORF Transcript_26617/g.45181 Transcript_26617/m.45181 type:complete len:91 (-) Transcript_26617:1846-2118(-)
MQKDLGCTLTVDPYKQSVHHTNKGMSLEAIHPPTPFLNSPMPPIVKQNALTREREKKNVNPRECLANPKVHHQLEVRRQSQCFQKLKKKS